MWVDPVVEEIHSIREAHAAQFQHDLKRIAFDLRRTEDSRDNVVSKEPRPAIVRKVA